MKSSEMAGINVSKVFLLSEVVSVRILKEEKYKTKYSFCWSHLPLRLEMVFKSGDVQVVAIDEALRECFDFTDCRPSIANVVEKFLSCAY
jgi:hypothetical protein